MYSYVLNNPLGLVDPSGLSCTNAIRDDGTDYQTDDGDGQGCDVMAAALPAGRVSWLGALLNWLGSGSGNDTMQDGSDDWFWNSMFGGGSGGSSSEPFVTT